MRNHKLGVVGAALAAMLFVAGCSGQPLTTREKGTGVGAVLGAGTGAIVGAAVGHPLAGAAIGGGLGGAAGFAVGNELQNQESQNASTRHALRSQQRELNTQRAEIHRLQQSNETE
jgi:phage tail tape-measure protein